MTDQRTTVEAGLQSEMISDVSGTSVSPLGPEARAPDRIARITQLKRLPKSIQARRAAGRRASGTAFQAVMHGQVSAVTRRGEMPVPLRTGSASDPSHQPGRAGHGQDAHATAKAASWPPHSKMRADENRPVVRHNG